jgi:hypothetical protein
MQVGLNAAFQLLGCGEGGPPPNAAFLVAGWLGCWLSRGAASSRVRPNAAFLAAGLVFRGGSPAHRSVLCCWVCGVCGTACQATLLLRPVMGNLHVVASGNMSTSALVAPEAHG